MVQFITEEDRLTCHFKGQMNTAKCVEIEKDLISHVEAANRLVVFDLAEVDYVASSFLRFCIVVCKKVGTDHFCVINAREELKKIFMVAGFGEFIRVE